MPDLLEPDLDSATRRLEESAAGARRSGRRHLLEPEALSVVRRLGLATPRSILVRNAQAAAEADWSDFGGDRMVVKVVAEDLLHKSDLGGVVAVPSDRDSVRRTVAELTERFADHSVHGFSLNEWVEFDRSIGGELLVGLRWTEDFGPVVTLAPGGVHADLLGRHLKPLSGAAVLTSDAPLDTSARRRLEHQAIVQLASHPQRGRPPRIVRKHLEQLLATWLEAAQRWTPHLVEELEINPLALTADGPVALDAVLRLGSGVRPTRPDRPTDRLDRLLKPASIAVIGVSRRPNPGHIIVRNILAEGFDPQRLWIVKDGADEMLGCRCVPDLGALPAPVDLLVLAVAAEQAGALVDQVVANRLAESLILIPGGLGERRGSEGAAREVRQTLDRSRDTDWRGPLVNGGNCLGIRSVPGNFNTLFLPRHKLRFPEVEPAPLAVLSQSGAFAAAVSSRLSHLNPRYTISFGNQLDLTVGDYLEHLEGDRELEVIACYIEGFQPLDGRKWLAAARRLTDSGRTVVLYRAGRSAAGARATATHTASIAGDYVVTRELAGAAGVLVADSLDDFSDLVRLCCGLRGRTVGGRRLGAVSNAGFECVAMADAADGFELPPFEFGTRQRLLGLFRQGRIDSVVGVANPLDLTPILDDRLFADGVGAVLEDPGIDLAVIGCVPLTGALQSLPAAPDHAEDVSRPEALGSRLEQLWNATSKAWVAVIDSGPLFDPMVRRLEQAAIPTFRTADRAVRMLRLYSDHRLDPRRSPST